MAATHLTFNGINSTDQGWSFALYQEFDPEPGLKSMAWKVLKLSKPQSGSTDGSVSWDLSFQVTIAKRVSGNVYVGGVSMDAKEGYNYEAVMEGGYIQIKETGKGTPGYINFKNNTHEKQNLGLNLSKTLLAMQEDVSGGVTAQFKITPTYYLGLYTNLDQGSFVSSDAAVGPIQITFPDGMNMVEVEAHLQEGVDSLSDPKYSYGDGAAMLSKPRYAQSKKL